MPELHIVIKGVMEWTDAPQANVELVGVDILESGTSGKRPAVYLRLKDKDGKEYIAATTAPLIDGLNGAVIGAQWRWEQTKKGN